MKKLILSFLFLFCSIFVQGQNLISNWSFETGTMQLVCNDWYNRCGDELTISCDSTIHCMVGFAWDSPSVIPEEVWSLKLLPGWPEEGFSETYVTGQTGTKIYQLTFSIKTPHPITGNYITGYGSIGTGSQNQFIPGKTISDTAIHWKQITIIDTLTTVATDTITIRLSAENCDLCVGSVYFDFVELTVIGTVISTEDFEPDYKEHVRVFPNPAHESIRFEFNNNKNENYILLVYNEAGELIKSFDINKNNLTIKIEKIAGGLYFYQIQRTSDKQITGKGKFIME
jgi:hypothetical protein